MERHVLQSIWSGWCKFFFSCPPRMWEGIEMGLDFLTITILVALLLVKTTPYITLLGATSFKQTSYIDDLATDERGDEEVEEDDEQEETCY